SGRRAQPSRRRTRSAAEIGSQRSLYCPVCACFLFDFRREFRAPKSKKSEKIEGSESSTFAIVNVATTLVAMPRSLAPNRAATGTRWRNSEAAGRFSPTSSLSCTNQLNSAARVDFSGESHLYSQQWFATEKRLYDL